MTGRDLIVYILANKLEDKPISHNGRFIGLFTDEEIAAQLGVGKATVYAMVAMKRIDHVCIGDTVLFPAIQPVIPVNKTTERNSE